MLGVGLAPQKQRRTDDPLRPFLSPSGGQKVAVAPAPDGGLTIWSEIGKGRAVGLSLDHTDPSSRLSWRETLLAHLRRIYPVGTFSLSGSWSQLQSSGSGLSGSYTGNRAVSSSSLGAAVEVTVARDKPYDLWVIYTGRTSGGFAKVEIDGGQEAVDLLDDPAGLGFKAFSTYAPADLTRRQVKKVASGLTGAHQVRISNAGAATPGGNALLVEAVAISAELGDEGFLPPVWQPNSAYVMGDEVRFGGRYYSARATGQSGVTGPTHSSGIASDGALDWRADFRPTYPHFVAIDYASEREYALRYAYAGATSEIGGQTHGGETLAATALRMDGVPLNLSLNPDSFASGNVLQIDETLMWKHENGTSVAAATLQRTVTAGAIHHAVEATVVNGPLSCEWLYVGLAPVVHWDGESASQVAQTVHLADSSIVDFDDYVGVTPSAVTLTHAGRLGYQINHDGDTVLYGMEADCRLPDLQNYVATTARVLPNIDGRTAAGSLDWTAKSYLQVAAPPMLEIGDRLAFQSRHVFG